MPPEQADLKEFHLNIYKHCNVKVQGRHIHTYIRTYVHTVQSHVGQYICT